MLKRIKLSSTPETSEGHKENNNVAETSTPFQEGRLVIGIDANRYVEIIERLWKEVILISIMLAFLGVFFSWLLYRYQTAFFNRSREFERQIAGQREEAALGRATATISHEIKNPLNAIGMGLQRLQFEVEMEPEHRNLVDSMLQALNRTNSIITDLKKYARPISPRYSLVSLHELVVAALELYRQKCADRDVAIDYDGTFQGQIFLDESLIGLVIENLLKNAIEAQPDGGAIQVSIDRQDNYARLIVQNGGLKIEPSEIGKILEPYYTTKTKGTGLGLALSKQIIEAHQGSLDLTIPEKGTLRIRVLLPLTQESTEGERGAADGYEDTGS